MPKRLSAAHSADQSSAQAVFLKRLQTLRGVLGREVWVRNEPDVAPLLQGTALPRHLRRRQEHDLVGTTATVHHQFVRRTGRRKSPGAAPIEQEVVQRALINAAPFAWLSDELLDEAKGSRGVAE